MSIGITVSIKESVDKIERMILEQIRDTIKPAIIIAANSISKSIKETIYSSIVNQPEWQSLKYGKLRVDFGIPDSINIDELLNIWINDFDIKVNPPKIINKQISGTITISIIEQSQRKVLDSSVSEIQSKGGKVYWLEWLLFAGDNIVVKDYHVIYNLNEIQQSYSRTGEGLMVRGNDFKVDSIYSGTIDNNFITRSLEQIGDDINKITLKEVIRHL